MKRTGLLQEIRIMRFEEVCRIRTEKRLSLDEAAELLGMCGRSFRRWLRRYEESGEEGLRDRRLDRAAHNAAPVDEAMALVSLYETRYRDFSVSHFYDKYRDCHRGQRGYTWVKTCLQEAGLVGKAKKRGKHRRRRPRKPLKGMMIHQDGSTHEWLVGQEWDLIVTLDDADNEIYSAFFVEEEGTWSSFKGIQEVIEEHGLFCSFYVDRGSHYFHTPQEGGKVDKQRLTQVGRAMAQLGIEMIAAYSPQARGRSERMFGTLQKRLPPELTLAGITDIAAANRFLKEIFIPAFNQRFQVTAAEEGDAFVPWLPSTVMLKDILCIQEQRVVNQDNTVSYRNKKLQIPRDSQRYSYAKTNVKVHEYQDGGMAVFHGPRCLGRYDSKGELHSGDVEKSIKEGTQKQKKCA